MKHCNCRSTASYLGDDQADVIIQNIITSARSIFPEQTAEAEAWIAARAASYGVSYAKYRAQQLYGSASEWLSNPLIMLGIGLGAGYFIFKR